jgi:hypothetical protein
MTIAPPHLAQLRELLQWYPAGEILDAIGTELRLRANSIAQSGDRPAAGVFLVQAAKINALAMDMLYGRRE